MYMIEKIFYPVNPVINLIMFRQLRKIKDMENEIDKLTHKIIGCAMQVDSRLGNGFQTCLPKANTACRQEVIYRGHWLLKWSFKGLLLNEKKKCRFFTRKNKLGLAELIFLLRKRLWLS